MSLAPTRTGVGRDVMLSRSATLGSARRRPLTPKVVVWTNFLSFHFVHLLQFHRLAAGPGIDESQRGIGGGTQDSPEDGSRRDPARATASRRIHSACLLDTPRGGVYRRPEIKADITFILELRLRVVSGLRALGAPGVSGRRRRAGSDEEGRTVRDSEPWDSKGVTG
jgi:hypothetical protein